MGNVIMKKDMYSVVNKKGEIFEDFRTKYPANVLCIKLNNDPIYTGEDFEVRKND